MPAILSRIIDETPRFCGAFWFQTNSRYNLPDRYRH
jgi:hypothetical protein